MSDLISRKALYEKIAELEEQARKRVIHTPKGSPEFQRYMDQLNERSALKHEIADAPTVEAVPVVHGEWINEYINRYGHPCHCCSVCGFHASYQDKNFCPKCGADMRKRVEHEK